VILKDFISEINQNQVIVVFIGYYFHHT